jgi:hypothetical protein
MARYVQWLQQSSYAASVDRRLMGALWPAGAVSGCAVSPASGMTVNIATGQIAVPTQNGTGATLCTSDAVEQVTLTAAPGAGLNRYDWIICQPRGNDLDGGANNDFIFDKVTGTPAASPVAPPIPAGAFPIAIILVPALSASITTANTIDWRRGVLGIATTVKARAYRNAAWTTGSGAIPYDTRSYDPLSSFNLATGAYTCPYAGDYLVVAQYGFNAGAAGQFVFAIIQKNGANIAQGPPAFSAASGNMLAGIVSDIVPCVTGDVLAVAPTGFYTGLAGATGPATTYMSVRLLP